MLQAAAYLGKAEELLRWSADLRGLQMPGLPAAIPQPWAACASQSSTASSAAASTSGRQGDAAKRCPSALDVC